MYAFMKTNQKININDDILSKTITPVNREKL